MSTDRLVDLSTFDAKTVVGVLRGAPETLGFKPADVNSTYLIIDQMQRRVDRHSRDVDGQWRHDVIADDGTVPVSFGSVSLTMTLDEIYEGVTLPTPEERLRLREEESVYG